MVSMTNPARLAFNAARALGSVAFARGIGRAPALDPEFAAMVASDPLPIGDARGLARLTGWVRGWDDACLAAPVG